MATPKEQFIEILKKDIQHLEDAAKRIRELLPHMGEEIQKQWEKTAAARKSMGEELRLLLNKVKK